MSDTSARVLKTRLADAANRPINTFAHAMKTLLIHAPYYAIIAELKVRDRRALPNGMSGLLEIGIPQSAAAEILKVAADYSQRPVLGVLIFTERMFALRSLAYSQAKKLEAYYRSKALSKATLDEMRERIDDIIRTYWPTETKGQIVRTPFDLPYVEDSCAANGSSKRAA